MTDHWSTYSQMDMAVHSAEQTISSKDKQSLLGVDIDQMTGNICTST